MNLFKSAFIRSLVPLVILLFFVSANVIAGKLDDFEASVKNQPPTVDVDNNSSRNGVTATECGDNSIELDCIGLYMLEAFFKTMFYGGFESLARVNISINEEMNTFRKTEAKEVFESFDELKLRIKRSPKIPFFRFDTSYHYINSNLYANDYRLELGYGPVAVYYNKLRFQESNPTDSLSLSQIYFSYRMSFGSLLEIDFGLGRFYLNGNNRTDLPYITIPIKIHRPGFLGVEYKPAWSGNLSDYDIGVFYHFQFVSVKSGYRWISTNTQSISGPYIGLTAFY